MVVIYFKLTREREDLKGDKGKVNYNFNKVLKKLMGH